MGSGLEPGPPPPPSDSTSPGPASNPTHPQLRSPFPPQAGAPRAGPARGPPRLLWTPRLRPHSPCGFLAQAEGSCRPARPTECSPENPRSSGGSAPGPPPPSRPHAPGRSGPASASSRCPRHFPIRGSRQGRSVACGLYLWLSATFTARWPDCSVLQKGNTFPPRHSEIDPGPRASFPI